MSSSGPNRKTAYWPTVIPMEDMEIQNGGKLTVRESQMAVFVNEGKHRRRFWARASTR